MRSPKLNIENDSIINIRVQYIKTMVKRYLAYRNMPINNINTNGLYLKAL